MAMSRRRQAMVDWRRVLTSLVVTVCCTAVPLSSVGESASSVCSRGFTLHA